MDPRQGGGWAIVHRLSQEVAGMVMYFSSEPDQPPEISYMLAARWRGRGLGGEAMAAAIAHLFAVTGIEALTADVAVGNLASIRLLEGLAFRPLPAPDGPLTVGLDLRPAVRWRLDADRWLAAGRAV